MAGVTRIVAAWAAISADPVARATLGPVQRASRRDAAMDQIVAHWERQGCLTNHNSRRVMEKLGMTYDESADFDHPNVRGPLQRHVLYRIAAYR